MAVKWHNDARLSLLWNDKAREYLSRWDVSGWNVGELIFEAEMEAKLRQRDKTEPGDVYTVDGRDTYAAEYQMLHGHAPDFRKVKKEK